MSESDMVSSHNEVVNDDFMSQSQNSTSSEGDYVYIDEEEFML